MKRQYLLRCMPQLARSVSSAVSAITPLAGESSRSDLTRLTVAIDPGCVKTLRGIIAPGILGSMVVRRAKKRKNLSSAPHYDQIRFRFHTTKTLNRHVRVGKFLQSKIDR
jgi:hypothetical protein